MGRAILLVACLALPFGASGCFLFHDDYPDESCQDDNDCFRAQGERCNLETNTCEVPEVDAGSSARGVDDDD